eukprot:12607437-Alexandrium_andersonii.AAC.1
MRDAIGVRFGRERKPGTPEHAEHNKCVGREAKRKFREERAKRALSGNVVKGKTYAKGCEQIDQTLGEMMTFGK